mgnify:CR=1 FL=1
MVLVSANARRTDREPLRCIQGSRTETEERIQRARGGTSWTSRKRNRNPSSPRLLHPSASVSNTLETSRHAPSPRSAARPLASAHPEVAHRSGR